MESTVQEYDNIMEHASNRHLLPPSSPDISYIVGAAKSNPQIGLEYQVEVPSMIKESERVKLLINPADSELEHNEVEDNVAAANLNNSWSDTDVKSFLLGLFIFGKNFVQIKRFLENKGMGEILSFYYGKFYKSDEYRRWSDCKKMKGRKYITGHKLFSGRKQRELLSRLIPHVSEEFKDALQQVSKSYSEAKTSLEEYISSLKSTVGLDVLVEAVGIGKGKEDLTSPAVEHRKKTKVVTIQTSKVWSSLGPSDIIKHLTGGYRLSKAKSNDIFWEAVWPRLLARGWHSEKLKNQGSLSTRNFVVFLLPGVKKFSKRKLVKGDHYFDSVSDVLSKVIAEPNLLKLTKVGVCNEEEGEKGSKEDGQIDNHHHCCLTHRASSNNAEHMKCTVLDTGLVHREKLSDLRYLKSLPGNSVGTVDVDADDIAYNKGNKHTSKTSHRKGKLENISPNETEAAMVYSRKNCRNVDCHGKHNRDATNQKEVNLNPDKDDASKMAENCDNQKTCVSDGNQPKRIMLHQFSRRARSDHSDHAVPPIKRQRLTAWAKAKTDVLENSSGGLGSEKLGLSQSSCFPDANKKAGNPLGLQQDLALTSSAEGSVKLKKHIVEKSESQHPINFNTPQALLESEDGEMMAIAEEDGQGLKPKDIIPRRKSTRNRPLTVRALESLTNEFLHVQRKQKRKDTLTLKDPFGTCSPKAHSHTKGLKNVA
ncbi:hypothetical protein VNO78_20436 [Psophocarpus tetragonolobus]|uniref:SANT domain-containing protein n=1 Tax=Psophocarpus tetragonolobus TaxID=3891 RepID=A0AAN9SAA3_PSOTE